MLVFYRGNDEECWVGECIEGRDLEWPLRDDFCHARFKLDK